MLQIAGPADYGNPIGGRLVSGGIELLVGQGLWVILGTQPTLLPDHRQLLEKRLLRQREVAHPLGLQLEGDFEPILGQGLEIGRVIATGKGVLVTAVLRDDAGELTGGEPLRTLEHHMLQHMGDTGHAAVLIARADLVPDLGSDDRGAMIGLHQHLQPIVQHLLMYLRAGHGKVSDQHPEHHQNRFH